MAMIPREHVPYSAIVDRPKLKLPGDGRIIVWTIVNLEVWDIGKPMARQVVPAPTGQVLLPDVPNWSWHEFGMRVGFWRFHALYERLGLRPTLSINARVTLDYPRVAQAAKDAELKLRARWPEIQSFCCSTSLSRALIRLRLAIFKRLYASSKV